MRNALIHLLLWLLAKLNAAPHLEIPPSVWHIEREIRELMEAEGQLVHGSTDIMGDSWLHFRRVATAIKKAHPEISKHDIFKSIVLLYEDMR